LGLAIQCLHSDVNSDLSGKFEIILMNPPFHVGKQVLLELPAAFIAAAYEHLVPGGEVILVANKALGYEVLLKNFTMSNKVAENQQFKVLRAIK
jgi:16S rRNA (guanine1207-N2)-methyltransferase